MVLDTCHEEAGFLSKSIQFDMVLFHFQGIFWLGSRTALRLNDNETGQLPNGMFIQQLAKDETQFVYHEIVNDDCYYLNKLSLAEDAVILDVGANIGLFTLHIKNRYPNSRVFAFEPSPHAYAVLYRNMQIYRDSVQVYPYAISSQSHTALFHYYQHFSVISGFYAEQQKDGDIIIQGSAEKSAAARHAIHKRLTQLNTCRCETYTLSDWMQKHHVEKIDLLKIDIEGAEWDALQGIRDEDWCKIKNITLEVHHPNLLSRITTLLHEKGFYVFSEPDKQLGNSGIYNLVAYETRAQNG